MNPYSSLPQKCFWKSGALNTHPLQIQDIYVKKFSISKEDHIATAGSCFAQHIARGLKLNGFNVIDAEPAPSHVSDAVANQFGYRMYSARYGNIYVVRQFLQIVKEALLGKVDDSDVAWVKENVFVDSMRPTVEPHGLRSVEEVLESRFDHVMKVRKMLSQTSVLVFTLGLTESWVNRKSGKVYPMCPGTVAGQFDSSVYEFKNWTFNEIMRDFEELRELLVSINSNIKFILTVSPVPLTATAERTHVLSSTTYSKSVLRAVAGDLSSRFDNVDYFPSYELIATPWAKSFFYDSNMRSVNKSGVDNVMRVFFSQHGKLTNKNPRVASDQRDANIVDGVESEFNPVCEEAMLEAFSNDK